ncbi:hypothetical protein AURDEDRAFT_187642 [Auricularia subglabra TFB-10046 SS5]|nr:hypothetical protein AURDEDRAFT_187642 [Auricularia subglabra TFB-10046 SS5]
MLCPWRECASDRQERAHRTRIQCIPGTNRPSPPTAGLDVLRLGGAVLAPRVAVHADRGCRLKDTSGARSTARTPTTRCSRRLPGCSACASTRFGPHDLGVRSFAHALGPDSQTHRRPRRAFYRAVGDGMTRSDDRPGRNACASTRFGLRDLEPIRTHSDMDRRQRRVQPVLRVGGRPQMRPECAPPVAGPWE